MNIIETIGLCAVAGSLAIVSFPGSASACAPVIDSYYTPPDTTNPAHPNQCDWVTKNGVTYCHIDLKGIKYKAAGTNPPVIVFNHGSNDKVQAAGASSSGCAIADYFVPLGYTVYIPVRRGHYAQSAGVTYRSTGDYIQDGDDKVDELVRQKVDVRLGVQHVKTFNGDLPTKFALMGNSYGGMVTVFANTLLMDQKAAVVFSPGGISWMGDGDPRVDSDGDGIADNDNDVPNTYLQNTLKQHVVNGVSTPFFLQAKWDHDTRPTSELAYTFANSSIVGGPQHGREHQAAIFDFGYPDDPQATHEAFPRQTALWGPTVYAFLVRHGVR
jgi:pimeloyl-ACP methyl ester carboxylesterase